MSPQQKHKASKAIRSISGQRRRSRIRQRDLKSFTVYVDEQEVYAKEIADALEAELQPLATTGLIARISKYDTNPANNPQPSKHSSERS
jgi:hypothetical protein